MNYLRFARRANLPLTLAICLTATAVASAAPQSTRHGPRGQNAHRAMSVTRPTSAIAQQPKAAAKPSFRLSLHGRPGAVPNSLSE